MTLLGSAIKKAIKLKSSITLPEKPGAEQQYDQLKELLSTAKNTAFGKYYGFDRILASDNMIQSYKDSVPIFNYDQLHTQWWAQQQKLPNITWPGKPAFFALSSGTTGKSSKRIPITDDFLQSMRNVGNSLVDHLPDFDFPEALFESEILMLSSSANLSKHDHGHLEGEISGINVSNFPGWYDMFYRPGAEIAAISDWDERVQRIAEKAPRWNIGAIAGIPSWVLLMIQHVMEYHDLNNIHEIWPNLTVYASGGVAFETYRKDFEKVLGHPITIMDTYLASEGFFSYTARPGTMDMKLALSHGYFYEFIPFDERGVDEQGALLDNPVSHTLEQIEAGQDYVLVISTCAGAWRYVIGDTIKFTNTDTYEIVITGRTKFFLNVVGSQLSEDKMDAALLAVGKELNLSINEYSVAAIKNEADEYIHQWIIVSDTKVDDVAFADKLDAQLKSANKNYKVARNKALKELEVRSISKETYYDFLESSKKKGGQVKTPKVMKEEKMNEFLAFIQS